MANTDYLLDLPNEIARMVIKEGKDTLTWQKDAAAVARLSPSFRYEAQAELFSHPRVYGVGGVHRLLSGLIEAEGRLDNVLKGLHIEGENFYGTIGKDLLENLLARSQNITSLYIKSANPVLLDLAAFKSE